MVAVPLSGAARPSSIRSVVVLPAPLGPRKPVTRPGPTSKAQAVNGDDSPVPLSEVVDVDHLMSFQVGGPLGGAVFFWPGTCRAGRPAGQRWVSCSPHCSWPGQQRDTGPMTAGRPARQPDPMTVQQVTGRTRQLWLLASGWLQAAEEDNEQVGSSRLDRPLSWLAVATAVVAFAFFAGTLILRALIAGRGHDPADHQVWSQALVGAAVAVPGALIAARRPRHPIGWLLLLAAVWLTVPAFGYEYARYTFEVHPGALPGGDWWLWASRREGAMADYALPFFLLLFPTGYLLSRRWRPVAWLIFAAITAINVVYALLAGDIVPPATRGNPVFYGVRNPVGLFGDAQHDWPWL